ncbi:unnamed protein product [Zymoseptoria tritici ST99CH_3D1]|nr:unnamed protein product [Zymoseptoria tritici ST99CH_3D1]
MSFGFSPSDIVTLVNLAHKTYRGWKTACGDYADITSSLDGLLVLLERIENEAEQPHTALIRSRKDRDNVRDIISACTATIQELSSIISRYRSLGLGKSREKNWEKICFGSKNLDSLKAKLLQHHSALSAYLSAVGLSSLTRIEQDLHALPDKIQKTVDGLAAEIRAGRREGSVMTTYDDDEKDVWRQFRRELIGDGLRSSFVHRYKPQIRRYLRDLAGDGLLEEAELTSEGHEIPRGSPPSHWTQREDKSPTRENISLLTPRCQTTCETDSEGDKCEREACSHDVLAMECGNSTPVSEERPTIAGATLAMDLDSSLPPSLTRDALRDAEETRLMGQVEFEIESGPPGSTIPRMFGTPLARDLYINDGVPIASSGTWGSNILGRATSLAGACIEEPVIITENTGRPWLMGANPSPHTTKQWSITGTEKADPKDFNTGPYHDFRREQVTPSAAEDGRFACRASVTELPRETFSAHALRHLNFNFHEFHDFFDVYNRVTEDDILHLVEVHDSLYKPCATWIDLNFLTENDMMILDHMSRNIGPSHGYWTEGWDATAVTLLPQQDFASAAILARGYILDRRIGGYYVVRSPLHNDDIKELRALSVSLRISRIRSSGLPRATSPTRNATCTMIAKTAHTKPFNITTVLDGETELRYWTTTWFPKASYAMRTMLALGCVIEHQKHHYIIRGASPSVAARRLQAAVELNDQLVSAQATGQAIALPTRRQFNDAHKSYLSNDKCLLYLLLCRPAGAWQGIWQICGPAPDIYAYRHSQRCDEELS